MVPITRLDFFPKCLCKAGEDDCTEPSASEEYSNLKNTLTAARSEFRGQSCLSTD